MDATGPKISSLQQAMLSVRSSIDYYVQVRLCMNHFMYAFGCGSISITNLFPHCITFHFRIARSFDLPFALCVYHGFLPAAGFYACAIDWSPAAAAVRSGQPGIISENIYVRLRISG